MLWKIGGVAVALLAAYFLVTMYGDARFADGKAEEYAVWQLKVVGAEQDRFAAYREGFAQRGAAQVVYRETVTKLQPIERRTIERYNDYARTPAGGVLCLAPDRVRAIEDARGALPAVATPADPGRPPVALSHAVPSQE